MTTKSKDQELAADGFSAGYRVGDRVRVHDFTGAVIEGVAVEVTDYLLEVRRDDGTTFTSDRIHVRVEVVPGEPA